MTQPAMHIITEEQLGPDRRFEGADHGIGISAFVVDAAPGRGPAPHSHPYAEIFVLQEGHISVTIGEETSEVHGPHVVIAPAGVPHRFAKPRARARPPGQHPHQREDDHRVALGGVSTRHP